MAPLCTQCVPALPPGLREAEMKRREEGKDRTKREMPRGEQGGSGGFEPTLGKVQKKKTR